MNRKCTNCNAKLLHYEDHDGFFCIICNEWREEKCNPKNGCVYCNSRPDIPLDKDTHIHTLKNIIDNGFDNAYDSLEDKLNN